MPSAKAISWAKLRVGLMALVALAILAVLIFLLTGTGSVFRDYAVIRTYMRDSGGLSENAPVRLNGILIGHVESVRLSNLPDSGRTVEVAVLVEERFLREIPADSTAAISAANLLGDKFINITKGSPRSPHIQARGVLPSLQAQDIPELMAQSAELLRSFQTIVTRFNTLLAGIEAGEGNIGKFLKDEEFYTRLNAVAAETERLLAEVRTGSGTLSRLINDDSLYQEVRAPLKRLDGLLGNLQKGKGTAGRLLNDAALYQELQATVREVRDLVAELNAGQGTAGKLLNDERLYSELTQLTARLDGLIQKVNSGQGTLGQLVVNQQLYESMNSATRELQALVKDVRANPKKFLSIKLSLF